LWVVPSRSRPDNIPRLFSGDTPFLLMLDDDDPMLGGYLAIEYPDNWTVDVGSRSKLSEIYNRAYWSSPFSDWYGVFADDVTPETEGWDRKLVEAAGGDGMAYGDDGIGEPTHFCLGGDLVREMGWLACPGLSRLYIDTIWRDIALSKNVLRYLPDVKITHRHPSVGLALMDATYRKPNKPADRIIYEQWKETR